MKMKMKKTAKQIKNKKRSKKNVKHRISNNNKTHKNLLSGGQKLKLKFSAPINSIDKEIEQIRKTEKQFKKYVPKILTKNLNTDKKDKSHGSGGDNYSAKNLEDLIKFMLEKDNLTNEIKNWDGNSKLYPYQTFNELNKKIEKFKNKYESPDQDSLLKTTTISDMVKTMSESVEKEEAQADDSVKKEMYKKDNVSYTSKLKKLLLGISDEEKGAAENSLCKLISDKKLKTQCNNFFRDGTDQSTQITDLENRRKELEKYLINYNTNIVNAKKLELKKNKDTILTDTTSKLDTLKKKAQEIKTSISGFKKQFNIEK